MPVDQTALKAKVMQEMEARLERKLQALADKDELDLREIEDLALELEHEMGQVLTQALVETQTPSDPSGVQCPVCQQKMDYKGKKRRSIRTRSGEVQVERAYSYRPRCRQGHFPPG